LKKDLIDVCSAGIDPHKLNPYAVTVMAEADETCPWFPGGSKVIHVGFDDPPEMAKQYENREEKLDCYKKVRDEIKAYVLTLPCSLKIFHR